MTRANPANKALVFTDGGARGNPGPAGIGVVLWEDQGPGKGLKQVAAIKTYIGEQTNNFAEYTALITALKKAAALGYKRVECYMDSELVVKQLKGLYKVREKTLKPLASKVLALTNMFSAISFTHIPREKNKEADKLVNQAIDEHLKGGANNGNKRRAGLPERHGLN